MTPRTRSRLLAGAGLVLLIGSGGYVYRVKRDGEQAADVIAQAMLKGYPAPSVDAERWRQVHVGMSKNQVAALLGEPPHKGSELGADSQEYWEYGHVSSAFAPVPDNRGHVVYFDKQGRVSSSRDPTQ